MQVTQTQPAAASSRSDAAVAARHAEFSALSGQAAEPAPAQPRQRGVDLNVASDLNDILAERDACGVCLHVGFSHCTCPASTARYCPAAAILLKTYSYAVQVGFIANLRSELSHTVVEKALLALSCMEHRGACSADEVSGDGAGIMTAVPWELLKAECPNLELHEKTTGCAAPWSLLLGSSCGVMGCCSHRVHQSMEQGIATCACILTV
jgi:Glutamine amidotransferases class-II